MTDESVPYKCPRGGNHRFRKRHVEVTTLFTGKKIMVWRRMCTKCGRPAGKFRLPPN